MKKQANQESKGGSVVKTEKRSKATGRPTIRDVSRLANVSRMTVSRVLGEPERVLPATRERVLRAIEDLGYVPDKSARSLSSRRTGFIGLVLPTLNNANFSLVAHGLTEAFRERGYHLLIAYTDYDLAEEERQLATLLGQRPEAILLTGAMHSKVATKMLLSADIPVMELADLPRHPFHHVVGFSNYEAGRTAARYLIERGFTKIGALGAERQGDKGDLRGDDRMKGFEDELKHSGLSTELVLRHGAAPVSYDHGSQALSVLLERDSGVEAVFAVSDLSAVGAIMECQRRNISVPEALSVIGFGDFEIGREVNPALTTIHVDFHALGRQAGDIVVELLAADEEAEPRIVDVGLTLLERGSVR